MFPKQIVVPLFLLALASHLVHHLARLNPCDLELIKTQKEKIDPKITAVYDKIHNVNCGEEDSKEVDVYINKLLEDKLIVTPYQRQKTLGPNVES
ncbi:hypothetical protein L596_008938 [Steinernema carpocapsae]|uniref:Uncharacterized protein n=1 Tax=Steinernema carpocapsae TaxID=34508 RepID=A0A4U5PE35_STECR|nr:hypothetical protein L596_008938 [Steinernema carpocapsae]